MKTCEHVLGFGAWASSRLGHATCPDIAAPDVGAGAAIGSNDRAHAAQDAQNWSIQNGDGHAEVHAPGPQHLTRLALKLGQVDQQKSTDGGYGTALIRCEGDCWVGCYLRQRPYLHQCFRVHLRMRPC